MASEEEGEVTEEAPLVPPLIGDCSCGVECPVGGNCDVGDSRVEFQWLRSVSSPQSSDTIEMSAIMPLSEKGKLF